MQSSLRPAYPLQVGVPSASYTVLMAFNSGQALKVQVFLPSLLFVIKPVTICKLASQLTVVNPVQLPPCMVCIRFNPLSLLPNINDYLLS